MVFNSFDAVGARTMDERMNEDYELIGVGIDQWSVQCGGWSRRSRRCVAVLELASLSRGVLLACEDERVVLLAGCSSAHASCSE